MPERDRGIPENALQLTPINGVDLVKEQFSSLHRPNAVVDQLWTQEAEDRIAAYDAGRVLAYDANEVFAELGL